MKLKQYYKYLDSLIKAGIKFAPANGVVKETKYDPEKAKRYYEKHKEEIKARRILK